MALVQMKCPNCGGNMQPQNCGSSFRCPHCGTTVLNIVDAKLDSDITLLTPEEFEQKVSANKTSVVVKIDNKIEEIDVDTTVINKKIQQATERLNNGNWKGVEDVFNDELASSIKDKWVNLPSVNRLRLLSSYNIKDESEFLLRSIDLRENEFFNRIINSPLCDATTKNSYLLIAGECKKNLEIDREIEEGYKLLKIGEYGKFLIYAQAMCNKYPFKIKSWFLLAEAFSNNRKQINRIYDIITRCPEFYLSENFASGQKEIGVNFNIPYSLKNKINKKNIREKKRREEIKNDTRKHLLLVKYPKTLLTTIIVLVAACMVYYLWQYYWKDKILAANLISADREEFLLSIKIVRIILISVIAVICFTNILCLFSIVIKLYAGWLFKIDYILKAIVMIIIILSLVFYLYEKFAFANMVIT